MKPLREAESNGVRCRWHDDNGPQIYAAAVGRWRDADRFHCLDHAAVFTALREQPYAPEVDPVVEAIREWRQADYTRNGHTGTYAALAATIRPLVLASATVGELVGELVKRGLKRHTYKSGDYIVSSRRVLIFPVEPTR